MTATELDVQSLAVLLGTFVPILVALVTKKYAHPAVKAVANVIGTVLVALASLFALSNDVTAWQAVNTVVVTFIASLAAYKGLWKPLNVSAWTAPHLGIGSEVSITELPGSYDTRARGGTTSYGRH